MGYSGNEGDLRRLVCLESINSVEVICGRPKSVVLHHNITLAITRKRLRDLSRIEVKQAIDIRHDRME